MKSSVLAASILMNARDTHLQVEALPIVCRPNELVDAYECQDILVESLLAKYRGKKIGYKIGCTNKSAQTLLNLDAPFHGKLISSFSHDSPASLRINDFFMCVIEPEFAFKIAKDLPPRSEAYSRDEIAKAIGSVLPAIEVVDTRYKDWTSVGALSLIADNACAGAWVKGKHYESWTQIDLAVNKVELYVNDSLIRTGRGDAVMGHPINALAWLANDLSKKNEGLKAGDLVTTGITCEVYYAQQGDHIVAKFGDIGHVEIFF